MKVKFTQIVSGVGGSLFALDDDGQVWSYGPPASAGARTIAGDRNMGGFSWNSIDSPDLGSFGNESDRTG